LDGGCGEEEGRRGGECQELGKEAAGHMLAAGRGRSLIGGGGSSRSVVFLF
jgi:hypothetical protein